MISLAGVDDKRRKPLVSQTGLPKSTIRRKPEVTPRAALEDATYRSNPEKGIGWGDWTHNIGRKPEVMRPARLEDTVDGASRPSPASKDAGERSRRKPDAQFWVRPEDATPVDLRDHQDMRRQGSQDPWRFRILGALYFWDDDGLPHLRQHTYRLDHGSWSSTA